MMSLGLAALLDALLGDPPGWSWHPIRLIGRLIAWLEPRLRQLIRWPGLAGGVLALGLPLAIWAASFGLCRAAGWLSPWLGLLASAGILYTCFSARDLASHALAVARACEAKDLAAGRMAVAKMVGRDTQNLDEEGVLRAAVESVAESCCDAVVAPLFFALLGGAPLCLAYKAVSTLDSMVGYRNPTYERFGMLSARLDDLLNWLPARLSALLIGLAAPLLGLSLRQAWACARADAMSQPSPNSGWPEAAFAGALGLRLGGLNYYQGVASPKPYLGQARQPFSAQALRQAVRLMLATAGLGFGLGLGLLALLGRL
jgi:adenosylcobinamide-phosphate synthase